MKSTRRGSFSVHRSEKTPGSKYSSTSGLSPHPIPLGCSRALALSALIHVSNFHWSSILQMVMYMFQCRSLKSSHPRILPQSKSLFFTCVSFATLRHHYCHFKFHIYALIYCISVSDFTLYNRLSFHPPH